MRPDTKLVWIETPANPLWTITDIAGVAEIAHAGGAVLGINSTAATPLFTKPLSLGADIVMHSATKYLNGHSDVVAGVLAAPQRRAVGADQAGARPSGAILGPFEAWLLLRGLRTLEVRVHAQTETAATLATRFAATSPISIGALSGPAVASGPRGRGAADERLRRHAVDPGQGRRARRHRGGGARRSCGSARPRSAAWKA